MSEQSVRHDRYETTILEEIIRALRGPVDTLLALVPAAVVVALVWVTGQLGERILASFAYAASQKFPTVSFADVWAQFSASDGSLPSRLKLLLVEGGGKALPAWTAAHFIPLVKGAFWFFALRLIARQTWTLHRDRGTGSFAFTLVLSVLAAATLLLGMMIDVRERDIDVVVLRELWAPIRRLLTLIRETAPVQIWAMLIALGWTAVTLVPGMVARGASSLAVRCVLNLACFALAFGLAFKGIVLAEASLTVPLVVIGVAGAAYILHRTKVPSVALREFKSLMLNPLGYVVAAGFAVLCALLFAAAVNELAPPDAAGVRHPLDEQSPLAIQPLTAFFSSRVLGFGFLILIPIITMRLVAEEKRSGTVEVLMTSPIREWHVILGKFFGAFGFYIVLWAIPLVHLVLLNQIGAHETTADIGKYSEGIDIRQAAGAYVGLMLIGAGFLSIGLFCSCLVNNQLAAAVLTLVAMLLFTFQGFVENLPSTGDWAWFGQAASYLDLRSHLEWSARGTPDSRTVFLFLSITGLFLFLAVRAFEAHRWSDVNLGRFGLVGKASTALLGAFVVAAAAYATVLFATGARWSFAGSAMPSWLVGVFGVSAILLIAGFVVPSKLGGLRALGPAAAIIGLGMWWLYDLRRLAPDVSQDFNYAPAVLQSVVAGLIVLILYLAIASRLGSGGLRNKLVFGSNVAIGSLAVLVVGIMLNYLAVRYHAYLDWSADESFTLHARSITSLAGLGPEERSAVADAADAVTRLNDDIKSPDAADDAALASRADRAAGLLTRIPAAADAREQIRKAVAALRKAEPDRDGARAALREADTVLTAMLPPRKADGSPDWDRAAAIPDGNFVKVIAFVGRYAPPKDRSEANDNRRRDVLERLFRRYTDSLNRPGDVKFEYEFVDPKSDRQRDAVGKYRSRHAIEGNRDVLILFNDRQYVITDDELFKLDLPMPRFADLVAGWTREFERGARSTKPPEATEDNRQRYLRPKELPPEFSEYTLREDDFELTAVADVENVVTNAVLRLVQRRLKILYFTQGHGERAVFVDDAPAKTASGPTLGADVKKDKSEDPAELDRRRITQARRALQKRNFQVRVLNAAVTKGGGEVPDDCSALVIADPTEDLLGAEVESIERYLARGGRLAILLDPRTARRPAPNPFAPPPEPKPDRPVPTNLLNLAAKHGVQFDDATVVLQQFDIQAAQRGQGGLRDLTEDVYLVSGTVRMPGRQNDQQARFYNDTLLGQKDAAHPAIKQWLDVCAKNPHPLFPGVTFRECRSMKQSVPPLAELEEAKDGKVKAKKPAWPQTEFTRVLWTGRNERSQAGIYNWTARKTGGGGPEDSPFGPAGQENLVVVAQTKPKGSTGKPWTVLAIGDADWMCDASIRDADEAVEEGGKMVFPSYLTHWHGGGEKLLIALMEHLCARADGGVEIPAKTPRPYRAVVERAREGELLVGFKPDVSAAEVEKIAEAVRKSDDALGNTVFDRWDIRRLYEFRPRRADTDLADLAAELRKLAGVSEARPVPAEGVVLAEFADGIGQDEIRSAAAAVNADFSGRIVRNQYRVRFAGAKLARKVRAELDKHADRIQDVQARRNDLLHWANIIQWGVLPVLLLSAGLWVRLARRQE